MGKGSEDLEEEQTSVETRRSGEQSNEKGGIA